MTTHGHRSVARSLAAFAVVAAAAVPVWAKPPAVPFSIAKIYWEYNASANDLGVHVSLDGEDWKRLKITNSADKTIFVVEGRAAYRELGMTELFFEGAEPSLDELPLEDLLDRFPEGPYELEGKLVDGTDITASPVFSHAIPAGPAVSATLGPDDALTISWTEVTSTPPGFPARPIVIVGYQVIVGTFQVTLPPASRSVTVPREYVASLASGVQPFEVLAIELSANQTLTEGTFVKP